MVILFFLLLLSLLRGGDRTVTRSQPLPPAPRPPAPLGVKPGDRR